MNAKQTQILRAVLECQIQVLWPGGGGDTVDGVLADLQVFLASASGQSQDMLNILLDFLAFQSLADKPSMPFSQWPPAAREAWLGDLPKRVLFGIEQKQLRDFLSLLLSVGWLVIYSRPLARALVWPHEPLVEAAPLARPAPARPNLAGHYAVCVVGSGAGGAVVASRLAEAGIGPILLLEAGSWIEPRQYSFRDDQALSRLYVAGGVQPALSDPIPIGQILQGRVSSINVLQGHLVGGGPAVNNALCLRIPAPDDAPAGPWANWQSAGVPIDYSALAVAYDLIEQDLELVPAAVDDFCGWRSALFNGTPGWGPMTVAIANCLGCGGCNVGCRFGRKTGGLQGSLPEGLEGPRSYLERALAAGAQIASQTAALSFTIEGGQAKAVEVRTSPAAGSATITIKADAFVLAAGPIASPAILAHTDLPEGSPVGKRTSANIVTPVYGIIPGGKRPAGTFKDPGLQMCYYVDQDGTLGETWFHFPGSIAVSLPGWFQDHYAAMANYEQLASIGVVLPSGPNGWVDDAGSIFLALTDGEFQRLRSGIFAAIKALFAAGATTVYLASKDPVSFSSADYGNPAKMQAALNAAIVEQADLLLATAHPQGGNAISNDPAIGVVDASFQVRGARGLYVADASLFPAGCGVNPMMTTMALAHLAADSILGRLAAP